MEYILIIDDLRVNIKGREIIKGISLKIPKGSTYALVGESGSGKSITCSAILGLLPKDSTMSGKIIFEDKNLIENPSLVKVLRGRQLAYIPQNPITSFNPVRKIYSQFREAIKPHKPEMNEAEIQDLCKKLLLDVQLRNYERVLNSYAFELSGGMCQRLMIALALLGEPQLLLADEPTTALDVTIQAEIMTLLLEMTKAKNLTLLLITHDLPLVAQSCQYISVIRQGKLCESGAVREIFENPQHEYTSNLLNSVEIL